MYKRKKYFTDRIRKWFLENGRSFLWRKKTDSFTVAISEIFLKKTRATNVEKPLILFLEQYKDFNKISLENPNKLKQYFKNLGLFNRGDGLKKLSQQICLYHGGNIPDNLGDLKKLYLIGEYCANAILCFSFGKRNPIVDINVIRIFKRFFGFEVLKNNPHKDRKIWEFSKQLLPQKNIRQYNWGLLDFGALVCTSRKPKCISCPIRRKCFFLNLPLP